MGANMDISIVGPYFHLLRQRKIKEVVAMVHARLHRSADRQAFDDSIVDKTDDAIRIMAAHRLAEWSRTIVEPVLKLDSTDYVEVSRNIKVKRKPFITQEMIPIVVEDEVRMHPGLPGLTPSDIPPALTRAIVVMPTLPRLDAYEAADATTLPRLAAVRVPSEPHPAVPRPPMAGRWPGAYALADREPEVVEPPMADIPKKKGRRRSG